MDIEEKKAIDLLHGSDSTLIQRKAGLKRVAELLEEAFILNMRPSSDLTTALDRVLEERGFDKTLKQKAKRLLKDYHLS